MKNERESRDARDPFDMFGGVGKFGGFGGSIFGRNPFDDPFFTNPLSSTFDQRNLMRDSFPVIPPNGPTVRELTSDDEDDGDDDGRNEEENEVEKGKKGAIHKNQPFIDHPDDETDGSAGDSEHVNSRTDYNRPKGTQAQTVKVHRCKVTYGGIDGVYYSSSATRGMGSDGVIMEECKEADNTKGEATHRISRGLHDKGHSLTRKLNPDGKVESMQALHKMNEMNLEVLKRPGKATQECIFHLQQEHAVVQPIRCRTGEDRFFHPSGTWEILGGGYLTTKVGLILQVAEPKRSSGSLLNSGTSRSFGAVASSVLDVFRYSAEQTGLC